MSGRKRGRPAALPYTQARLAMLADLWPRMEVCIAGIWRRLNILPGPPISSPHALHSYTEYHGYGSRVAAAVAAGLPVIHLGGTRQAERVARMTPEERRAMVAPAADARRRHYETPERETLLRARWPDLTVTDPQLTALLDKLPGDLVMHETTMRAYALRLGLGKSRVAAAAAAGLPTNYRTGRPIQQPRRKAAAAPKPPAAPRAAAPPKPTRAAAPPPAPPATPAPAPELAMTRLDHARALLAEGRSESLIAEYTGLDAAQIAALRAESAATADAKKAARHDRARALLRKRIEPAVIASTTKLPLWEVFRLAGELREARRAA